MNIVDLHVHSTKSDGSYTPTELVNYALEKGLSAFALTDHDTTDGIEEALEAAKGKNIEVIPGIEFSSEYEGKDIHILGLNINHTNPDFLKQLEQFQKTRFARNQKMIELLNLNGFNITPEGIKKRFGNAVITRAHYAILMVEGGYVKDKDVAFHKYLNPGCLCYVPRTKVSVTDAVEIILKAEGKPVLAHPLLYKLTLRELENLVSLLKPAGLQGIEAIYSSNKWDDESRMKQLAKKYDLFITGGTDFHGTAKPTLDLGVGYGNMRISPELLEHIL